MQGAVHVRHAVLEITPVHTVVTEALSHILVKVLFHVPPAPVLHPSLPFSAPETCHNLFLLNPNNYFCSSTPSVMKRNNTPPTRPDNRGKRGRGRVSRAASVPSRGDEQSRWDSPRATGSGPARRISNSDDASLVHLQAQPGGTTDAPSPGTLPTPAVPPSCTPITDSCADPSGAEQGSTWSRVVGYV